MTLHTSNLVMKCVVISFLAHLSYAQDELLRSLFVCHLSVRPSTVRLCIRRLTFSNDFSSEAAEPILLKFIWSLGWGNEKLLKWSQSVDQDGRHAHIW